MFETIFIVAMLLFISSLCFVMGMDLVFSRWSDRTDRAFGWIVILFGIFIIFASGVCVYEYFEYN